MGLMEYKKKNGNQQAIKLPIIRPRINVALRSFFLAIRFFSFSASCCGVSFGPPPRRSVLLDVVAAAISLPEGLLLRPKQKNNT